MREKIQSLGGFLAGMIIPNIGAFIAWGLITALFIPTGWIPNERFGELVGPMITYLLPLLIGLLLLWIALPFAGTMALFKRRGIL